jgi:hypothetical protein
MKRYVFFCALLSFFLFCSPLASDALCFGVPERLVYDLTWAGIKAGTATLEIVSGGDLTKIVSTARSAGWVSLFFTVDDRTETVLTKTQPPSVIGMPQDYKVKIREGRQRRDKELVFDYKRHKVLAIDHLEGERKGFDIEENTLDPLSSFYYLRTLKIEVGKRLFVDIFDSKKLWNVEVQVLRKERIKTKLGNFDTIVIKPLLKSEGIFNRRGDMYIWLTDDARHLPVQLKTKVVVGFVTATIAEGNY